MTLNEAILSLRHKGLPHPSPISVFWVYEENEGRFWAGAHFDRRFHELLAMQKAIKTATLCNKAHSNI
jgi:hypothetical protein